MQFNFTYAASVDSTVPTAFKTVLAQVANLYSSLYTDNITLNYHIGWGEQPLNGSPLGANTLGQANSGTANGHTYAQVRNAFINDASGADDAAALATLGATSPVGSSTIFMVRSMQKALGLIAGNTAGVDGYLGISKAVSWDYDNTNGVTSGTFDLFSVMFHEIGHLLGRSFNFGASGNYFGADLFHWDAAGNRTSSLGGYVGVNGTVAGRIGQLEAFQGLGSASDFIASNDPYSYVTNSGTRYFVTEADIRLNDLLGYNRASNAVAPLKTAATDFNGDNKSDVLLQHSGGQLATWFMNGGSISQNLNIASTPTNLQIQNRSNDYNGDGRDDILWRNASTGDVSMWLMNGSQVQQDVAVAQISTSYRMQGVGDFNGDGKADVVWRHSAGAVALWTMNGAAIINNVNMPSIDNSWRFQATGDFNGDGKSDILWRHISGQVVFWGMNGATIQTNLALQAQIDLSWHVAGTGDFNGDGKADIVWRHNNGFVSLWTMDGPAITSNTAIAAVDNNWAIRNIGDYNGDGKSDLLWQDVGSGFVAMWQMNGSAIAANVPVTTLAPNSGWDIAGFRASAFDFV